MKRRAPLSPLDYALPAGVALATALVSAVAISALAKPHDFETRTAAAEAGVAAARRALQGANGVEHPAGAVCASSAAEAGRLQAALLAESRRLQLQTPAVDVTVGGATRAAGGLSMLAVRLQAEGGYAEALALIARLEEIQPTLYLDTVDLVSKTSAVSLSVTGRAYCAAS